MRETGEAVYRILDASANRAAEGMRTVEEYVRFVLDDARLTQTAKCLRHDFAAAMGVLPRVKLLAQRDTEADVGTRTQTSSEYERNSIADVVRAAVERVQQSLRVLEEYGKTINPEFARRVESLRYRAYTFHRDLEVAEHSFDRRERLRHSTLYVLIECLASADVFETTLRSLAEAGVDVVQLRDKQADDRTVYERACLAGGLSRELGLLFIVNDRADIAAASDADGVHVGQSELPVREARRVVGAERLVGVSTHNLNQVRAAISERADYIGCGPTFPGNTKSFTDFPGCEFLREVHQGTVETPLPAFAIGGIDRSNVQQIRDCGFHRIAISGAVMQAEDPSTAAAELKRYLSE
ncbi:MAG: thiamine phosphate synthase [Planctomycetota bacterium]